MQTRESNKLLPKGHYDRFKRSYHHKNIELKPCIQSMDEVMRFANSQLEAWPPIANAEDLVPNAGHSSKTDDFDSIDWSAFFSE